MRAAPILLLALALVGCSGGDNTLKGMEAVNNACKKHGGELTVAFEAGLFGNTAKVSCTARVYP
jgi:hypothetical protein